MFFSLNTIPSTNVASWKGRKKGSAPEKGSNWINFRAGPATPFASTSVNSLHPPPLPDHNTVAGKTAIEQKPFCPGNSRDRPQSRRYTSSYGVVCGIRASPGSFKKWSMRIVSILPGSSHKNNRRPRKNRRYSHSHPQSMRGCSSFAGEVENIRWRR